MLRKILTTSKKKKQTSILKRESHRIEKHEPHNWINKLNTKKDSPNIKISDPTISHVQP